jgi:hypothetical protein
VSGRRWIRPFLEAKAIAIDIHRPTPDQDVVVRLATTAADGGQPASVAVAFDEGLLDDPTPAAFGAFDCGRHVLPHKRELAEAWKVSEGPGAEELLRLADVQAEALDGSCSFAVHTKDNLLATDISYRLRSNADPQALERAVAAAVRSGGLPNLDTALDDLTTAEFLVGKEDGKEEGKEDGKPEGNRKKAAKDGTVLALTRVLGEPDSNRTRYASALYGGGRLVERMVVRDGHLLTYAGAGSKERLQRRSATREARGEVKAALAAGRGKAGFLYADLMALYMPFVKASQFSGGDLSKQFAENPELLKKRLPLLLTLEPAPGLDATIKLPSDSFAILVALLPW